MHRGAQKPRIEHVPPSVDNEAEDVIDLAESVGLILDPWQRHVLRGALGVRADGQWAAFEVGLIVPRQNGKGAILEALVLAWLFLFEERKVLFSAHEMKTAVEMFKRIKGLIESSPDLSGRVANFYGSNERTAIVLHDGAECRFLARSTGSGRGFSADKIVFDEAFNLPDSTADAQIPTVGAMLNPQIWYTSSAGDEDIAPCDVLARIRRRGVAGADNSMAFFEWSVEWDEKTGKPKGDPADPKLHAQANPGLGIRKRADRIAALQRTMSPDGFAREELSVGNYPDPDDGAGALPYMDWLKLEDADAPRGASPVFGLDVPEDRSGWFAVAWRRPDDSVQVMLANDGEPIPAHRVAAEGARLSTAWSARVMAPRGFVGDLHRAGARVEKFDSADFAAACGAFADAVSAGTIHHGNQPALNAAVKAAVWRPSSVAGERAFQLKDMPEVGPLAAAVRAVRGLPKGSGDVWSWDDLDETDDPDERIDKEDA